MFTDVNLVCVDIFNTRLTWQKWLFIRLVSKQNSSRATADAATQQLKLLFNRFNICRLHALATQKHIAQIQPSGVFRNGLSDHSQAHCEYHNHGQLSYDDL